MKILVCGGTGFVGSAIVEKLVQREYIVRVLTRKPPSCHQTPNVEYVQGNVFNGFSLADAMKECDAVINAVQFDNAPFENPRKGLTYARVDGDGTERIVREATKAGIRRFLYVSGAGTAADKTEPWFQAKWRAESAIRKSGMAYTIFRPSWIYGSKDRSLNRMIQMIRLSPIVLILGGHYRIQPVFVDDVARILAQAVELPEALNQTYEVGGPQALSMKEILQCVAKVVHKKRRFVTISNLWYPRYSQSWSRYPEFP